MTLNRSYTPLLFLLGLSAGCRNHTDSSATAAKNNPPAQTLHQPVTSINGTWCGVFEPAADAVAVDKATGDTVYVRPHAITLFVDRIENGEMSGHSVCAGMDRPFSGV